MLYRLAEQLGQTVEWVMHNVSVLELRGWAKYYKIKADAAKRKR
jgi:hypothetical protein